MDITIIIPIYNRKDMVDQLMQHISDDYHVLIVDNNSTDGTYQYLRNYVDIHRRRRTKILRETVTGAAAARNCGLKACTTKWVYFFDSDDIFGSLPSQWDEAMDMVCFPVCQVVDGKPQVRDYKPVSTPHTHILNGMLDTLSMIFRTDFLRQIGGWNPNCLIWDDWELGMRALMHTDRVQWITDQARHRILVHPESITGPDFSQRYQRIKSTMEIAIDEAIDADVLPRQERKRCLMALYLRTYIYIGKLRHEGDEASAADLRRFVESKYSVGVLDQRVANLLEWFTAKGMRGAWRIALVIVDRI